jgi:hypothetical protein
LLTRVRATLLESENAASLAAIEDALAILLGEVEAG